MPRGEMSKDMENQEREPPAKTQIEKSRKRSRKRPARPTIGIATPCMAMATQSASSRSPNSSFGEPVTSVCMGRRPRCTHYAGHLEAHDAPGRISPRMRSSTVVRLFVL